jgi:hypothetical protein
MKGDEKRRGKKPNEMSVYVPLTLELTAFLTKVTVVVRDDEDASLQPMLRSDDRDLRP